MDTKFQIKKVKVSFSEQHKKLIWFIWPTKDKFIPFKREFKPNKLDDVWFCHRSKKCYYSFFFCFLCTKSSRQTFLDWLDYFFLLYSVQRGLRYCCSSSSQTWVIFLPNRNFYEKVISWPAGSDVKMKGFSNICSKS